MIIITDSPSLFSPENNGTSPVTVIPACTIIGDKAYRDITDISSERFLEIIEEGAVATSSQPAIGDIIDVFENADDDLLVLPIGDGLSGTYQNMVSAKNLSDKKERIHIVDTGTLAGPQNYLVKKALSLLASGAHINEIKDCLKQSIDSSYSFVIPKNFEFLKRSGRLTPFAAKLGTVMKIVPVMTLTEDKKRITKFAIKTSPKSALNAIIQRFKEFSVGKGYLITVCHAGNEKDAAETMDALRQSFDGAEFETHLLPPSLVCHGGPGCILVQAVKL